MTEAMVVENLLSQFPIIEMQHELQRNALVATLLNGEKRMVEFEKTVVPAEVAGKYIIVEHTFPASGILMAEHLTEPVGSSEDYLEAQKIFKAKVNEVAKTYREEDGLKEILLVAEFKNRKLDFLCL